VKAALSEGQKRTITAGPERSIQTFQSFLFHGIKGQGIQTGNACSRIEIEMPVREQQEVPDKEVSWDYVK